MSDILIIAPTRGVERDPAQKEINDVIKDQTDAVNLEKKYDPQLPKGTSKAPEDMELKRYHDMRPIRDSVPRQDERMRKLFFAKKKLEYVNGVSYPDNGTEANLRHWRGLDT